MKTVSSKEADSVFKVLQANYGGKKAEKYIHSIRCLECECHEAFCYFNNPSVVSCNRENQCGAEMEISRYVADLEATPLSAEGLLATRGLGNLEFSYCQGESLTDNGTFASAIIIPIDGETSYIRFLDASILPKCKFDGPVAGKVYFNAAKGNGNKILLTESIIDTLSLNFLLIAHTLRKKPFSTSMVGLLKNILAMRTVRTHEFRLYAHENGSKTLKLLVLSPRENMSTSL